MSNVNDDDSSRDGDSVTVEAGVGVVALLMTVVLAPLVIAIAWFVYRPLVTVIVLMLGGVLAYGAIHWVRARKAARLPKAAPAT